MVSLDTFRNAIPTYLTDANGNPLSLTSDAVNGLNVQIHGPGGGTAYCMSNDGDATPAFVAGVVANTFPKLFNGSSWDRQRGDANGAFVQGSSANGAANTGNPLTTGGVANSSTPTAVPNGAAVNARYSTTGSAFVTLATTSGSSLATASTVSDSSSGSSILGNSGYIYNGTTFDRLRDANTASGSTGTGVPSAGILGHDGTNYQRLSTTTSGSLNVAFGGVTVGATSIATDALTVASSVRVASFPALFNGTSWDRARGDAIGGQYVQERERASMFAETGGALAGSATSSGATRDGGLTSGTSQWANFSVIVRADQSGTVQLQGSDDGASFVTVGVSAYSANAPTTLSTPVFYRYYRAQIINGTTAATVALFRTRFSI